MFKKSILAVIFILFFTPVAFAVDKNELNLEFFDKFNDKYLSQYINEALENNHSAKQATARVEEYRQNVKSQFANELPSFSVAGNYLGVNIPKLNPNLEIQKNAFILPFIANYEADFLLKNRDKTKSTKKTYEMSKFDETTAYLSLLTDVATVYTNILQYDKLIDEQEKSVENFKQILNDNNKKLNQGVINSTEVNNAKSNFETSKITLENLEKQREILLMEFSVLLGKNSDNANALQRGSLDNFEYSEKIPNEIKSDVIFSRPDVKRAETSLEKAKIDIRIARKEFLPTFNITGIWAFNTIAPGTFFSWESSLAAIIAGASQDIFTGGRKIANLKIQKAKYEELFEKYNQTNLDAVKEVNTSLCIMKHDLIVDKNTLNKLNYENKNLQSSERKLNQGVISQSEYLKTLSNTVQLKQESASAKTQRIINYFTLYKAVGGQL